MAFVGEAAIAASVKAILEKVVSRDFVDFVQRNKLSNKLLRNLKITLLALQAVLNDAEEKQFNNPAVKEWLNELTYAIFDAEDLFDKINTEALRCKVEGVSPPQTIRYQVWNFLSSPSTLFKETINSKIRALLKRLELFVLQKDILRLKEGVSSSVWHGTPTTGVIDNSAICGRDDDIKKLKSYLLTEHASGSGNKVGVITIVGIGGIGKTTLAKCLYHDPEVKDKFYPKAWAYISNDFDVCRVTTTLLESVCSKPIVTNNPNTLQVQLQQSLSNKRYLLVLDDMWDGSYDDWTNLKPIFNAGEMGSKIIITTRDEGVARTMKTFLPIHYLKPLSSEDCWSLLATHAFGSNNYRGDSELEKIGKDIAEKCGGLPLAAKTIGDLLRTDVSEDKWNNVLKSNIWDLPNVNVLPALLLSYHYLRAPLKQCFSYCSVFPKNSKIEKRMVVQLWIAEGLVSQSKSEKTMEEVGDEYFDELVLRSMIGRSPVWEEAHFIMHDLISDVATFVSAAYSIRYKDKKPHESLERIRHLSYNRGKYDNYNKFATFSEAKSLRSFLALPLKEWWSSEHPNFRSNYLSNKVVQDLLPTMRKLRVLSLSHYHNITELSSSFLENLIYLRYLDLSNTKIERLPNTMCKLYNLQTLLLSNCKCLTELPKDIGNLVNLRHLDISGTNLKELPIQIAGLQNLQTLSTFIISQQQNGLNIGELGKFPHLQGKLSILKLQNVTDPCDAFKANLRGKKQIDELALEWDEHISEVSEIERQRLVLEQLQPSTKLKRFTIKFYGGTIFPNWLGDSSFGNMVYLCISDCDHCWSLPPLGQLLSLKELRICRMKSVKTVGSEFYGSCTPSFQPFPSLLFLRFEEMPEWEEWNLTGGTTIEFPHLRILSIMDCPKLKGNLPSNLPYLHILKLKNCPLLVSRDGNEVDNSNIRRPSDLDWMMHTFNSLEKLTISDIPSLTSFPRDGLPTSLRSLGIENCENVEFLPLESLHSYTSLEDLTICNSCCSMTSFTLGSLPVLKTLKIEGSKNLKSISIAEEDPSQSLSFLQSFHIHDCPELESFPGGGLPTPNLTKFWVSNCDKLDSLPEPINAFAGLQELGVRYLPMLQSFAVEGLPINLLKLHIGNRRGIFPNTPSEWGLQRLTCLSELGIGGDNLVDALMKTNVPLLPTSLVSLRVHNLFEVKCLDGKWLQHLTSLENLEISYCRSLDSLPAEGLPSSLSVLIIQECPLLEASCQKEKRGKEWPKIAHIPCIVINDQVII